MLSIENFRCIEAGEWELVRGGFFTGMNGAGKSTILDAVRLCLTGQCRGTDRRGAGAKLLIGKHGPMSIIQLQIRLDESDPVDIKVQIAKTTPHLTWTATHKHKSFTNPEVMYAHFRMDPNPVFIAVWPEKYLQAILSDYLATTLDAEVPYQEMRDHFGDDEVIKYIKTKWEKRPGIATVDQCREVGELAFTARRDAKKAVKELLPVPDFPVSSQGDPLLLEDMDRLDALVKQLNQQRDKLIAGRSKPADLDPRVLRSTVDQITQRLEQDKELLAANKAAIQENDRATSFCKKEDERRTQEKMRCVVRLESAQAQVANAEAMQDGPCPLCGSEVDKARIAGKAEEAQKEAADAQEALTVAESKVTEIVDKLVELRNERAQLEHPSIIEDRIQRQEKELKAATAALERTASSVKPADMDKKVQVVEERIAKAQDAINILAEIASAQKHNQAQEDAKWEVAVLDRIVKAFRDGELLNRFAKTSLDDFASEVNAVLEPIGKKVRFVVEGKAVSMYYQNAGGPEYDMTLASRGEQKCIEIAVLATFAKKGVPIAVVDDMDCLDDGNRRPAMKLLKGISQDTPVVMSATWTKPGLDGQAFETLERYLEPMPLYRL